MGRVHGVWASEKGPFILEQGDAAPMIGSVVVGAGFGDLGLGSTAKSDLDGLDLERTNTITLQ